MLLDQDFIIQGFKGACWREGTPDVTTVMSRQGRGKPHAKEDN
jgi:hypothetical protein